VSDTSDIFVTETMAELSARQGRIAEAIAIYRRLLDGAPAVDTRRVKWDARLSALTEERPAADTPAPAPVVVPAAEAVVAPPPQPVLRLPLVVREPVRSGQIVYAQHADLIVLAPVNPGAQLLADGNIHIYAVLRGRAIAGVRGATDAQIFCHRLEPELVGIDAAYVMSDDVPAPLWGRSARIWLAAGHCRLESLGT
jgi:septum site-determining protein MinC